jgi:cytochrome c oxidase subunit I+III
MSTPIEEYSDRGSALRLHRQLAAIWATGPGLQRLASVNHSVIGVLSSSRSVACSAC